MEKLIKWVDNSVELVLHINTERGWIPYYAHQLCQPDHVIPGIKASKGFATAQYLLKLGYQYVTDQKPAEEVLSTEELFNERVRFLRMSGISDGDVELENLRSYYNSGKMLMQGLTEDGMYDKMASALWAAQTNLIIASNPEMKGFTISYKDLPDEKKSELKVMVRFVIGVVIGTFPAMNMRNIQHQLESSK